MLILEMKKLSPRGRNHTCLSPQQLEARQPRSPVCWASPGTRSEGLKDLGQQQGPEGLPPGPTGGEEGCCALFSLCLLIAWKQS